jgi:hypothetical protein
MRGWPKLHAKIPSRLRDQRHAEVRLKTHEKMARRFRTASIRWVSHRIFFEHASARQLGLNPFNREIRGAARETGPQR